MDLAIGAKDVFVMMTLFAKDGAPKLVTQCTYPLTGLACVSGVYTEHATFLVGPDGITVIETFENRTPPRASSRRSSPAGSPDR